MRLLCITSFVCFGPSKGLTAIDAICRLVTVILLSFVLLPSLFSASIPNVEQLVSGIYAAGFPDRYGSANCGWIATKRETLLIDVPRGLSIKDYVKQVVSTTGKPAETLILTGVQVADAPIIEDLVRHGIKRVITTKGIKQTLDRSSSNFGRDLVRVCSTRMSFGDPSDPIEILPFDQIAGGGAAAVYLSQDNLLFAGPIVVNGPRAKLPGSDTISWISALAELQKLGAKKVVPGFGSWGDGSLLVRQRDFLVELRRQVGHWVAQGRSLEFIERAIFLPASVMVWMPYDTPKEEDIHHLYTELTVPHSPFNGHIPEKVDQHTHALVLIGDLPHEPGHIEEGLTPVFESTRVIPHFTVDVRALSAENLARVQLLVILRDGMNWPEGATKPGKVWMTPEQQAAITRFVETGGAFLNLHNAMGLYPENGPYLKLVGGRYIGHGPLERFRVEVVDSSHPITQGIEDFFVADEQHTPPYEKEKVHLLLQNRSDDGTVAAAGWAYEAGQGRLCHLANGHTRESLLHPMFQRLLRNAVNWCLRVEKDGSR